MSIQAWRIVKVKLAATAFTGEGARRCGGRWNSPGVPVIYTAGSVSLAILEVLVHVQSRELLESYVLFEVSFDEKYVQSTQSGRLPRNWRKSPPGPASRRIGDEWVAACGSAVLKVPSVVVPSEWNYLLNPAHPDFKSVIIGPRKRIQFDPRLTK